MHALVERVEAEILARRLLPRNRSVLVAVSGGLDSMVLLWVLRELAPRHGWRLCVAHCNHGLRGASSRADERLVRATSRRWDIPCIAASVEVKRRAQREGISLEMAARDARHVFLARAARLRRIGTLAVAHQADDQVELFFLRLLRGAGSLGLSGMRWKGRSPADARLVLVRPLLGCSRPELAAFAEERRVPFREDASNVCLDMLRNRIRHELVPLLTERYQPGLRRVVLREIEILEAESRLISELASACRGCRREEFDALPLAVQRAVVREALSRRGLEPGFEALEELRLFPGRPVTLAAGIRVVQDGRGQVVEAPASLAFDAQALPVQFHGESGGGTFGGLNWRWRKMAVGRARPRFGPGREWFDAEKVGSEVVLRHWVPGDRFQPCGAPFVAKLQDLFTNQKIPPARRRGLVVGATREGAIWWVEGLRIGESFKLGPKTRRVLQWSWERPVQNFLETVDNRREDASRKKLRFKLDTGPPERVKYHER